MQKILGNDYIIYINTVDSVGTGGHAQDANYRGVACLVTNGFSTTTDSIDSTSKCSGPYKDSEPGDFGWSITGEGQAIDDISTAQTNYQELLSLSIGRRKFWAKMADPTNNIVREGVVWISSYAETAARNTPYSFNITFQGTLEPIILATT